MVETARLLIHVPRNDVGNAAIALIRVLTKIEVVCSVCVCFTWSLSFTTSSSWTEMVLMRLRYISQSF